MSLCFVAGFQFGLTHGTWVNDSDRLMMNPINKIRASTHLLCLVCAGSCGCSRASSGVVSLATAIFFPQNVSSKKEKVEKREMKE